MTSKIWFLPKKPNTKRVLFHAKNHIGLGHLNRSMAVAQSLKAGITDLQVLFLIEGGEDFIEPTGFPWILIPSQSSEDEHCWQITQKVLEVFRPTLTIHDVVLREPVHRAVRDVGVKQVLIGRVGGLLRNQFRYNLAKINEIDLLIVPHQRDEVNSLDQALLAQYKGRTVYAGPIVRPQDRVSGNDLWLQLHLTEANKIILLTLGGGGYSIATELLTNLLAAKVSILDRYPEAKLIAVTGPHFSGSLPKVDEFVCYTSHFEPFFTDYLNIASVVVCMAGYNTINEVAATGLPTICVPSSEADDQVGTGNMAEYAQSFPNIVVGNTDTELLARHITNALGCGRYVSVSQEFRRRAEIASQRVVAEIKGMLDAVV